MTFGEKLARLTDGKHKQQVGRESGLPPTAVSDYIAKGHVPRADKGIALARTLEVSADWLYDDARDWPPPAPPDTGRPTAAALSDDELMLEVARRYRLEAVRYFDALNRAEPIDWDAVAERVLQLPIGSTVPSDLVPLVKLASTLDGLYDDLCRYEPSIVAMDYPDQVPGGGVAPEELIGERLLARDAGIAGRSPGRRAVEEWARAGRRHRSPAEAEKDEERRRDRLEEVRAFRTHAMNHTTSAGGGPSRPVRSIHL